MGKAAAVTYLSPEKRNWYAERIREFESRKKVIESGGTDKGRRLGISSVQSIGTDDIDREIARLKSIYKKGVPGKHQASTKNRMYASAKVLLSKIMVGMPSKSEMWAVQREGGVAKHMDKYDFKLVVDRLEKWEKNNAGRLREFRNMMLVLEPDNPAAGSTPFIRGCSDPDDYFNKIKRM